MANPDLLVTVLALTACVRNEEAVLPAFLAYHHALGVRRAYLYLDRCTDRSAEIAAGHDWVTALPARRGPGETLEYLQLVCADDALRRARAEGVDWLVHIDPDEFAWGGPLAFDGPATRAGDLRAMLGRVAPSTEAVWLRTLEAVPVRRPPGAPFWTRHAMLDGTVIERDVLDPASGELVRLRRGIGHFQGKSIARVAAGLQAGTAHRWTRRQAAMPPALLPIAEEHLGCHFHYVVRDGAHWRAKYAQMSDDADTWLRGAPMEFPKRSWKRVAASMTEAEATRYFDAWVAVPDDVVAAHRARGAVVDAPHVERVLQEIGFAPPAGRAVA